MAEEGQFVLHAKHAGSEHRIILPEPEPSLKALGAAIQELTGLSVPTLKLMGKNVCRGASMLAFQQFQHSLDQTTTKDIELQSGARVMLLGSKANEVEAVEAAKAKEASLRLPGFEREELMAAKRRKRTQTAQPPKGTPFTFHNFKVLPQHPDFFPPPAEALKLLYRLASDPGIMRIMADNQFQVGSLNEMPPEGLVGVSETCVLGYNMNRGQEIYLRLRTDDGRGFRKFRSILLTLTHELTHNVIGPHNLEFKQLCSKLNSDVNKVHSQLVFGSHSLHEGLPKEEEENEEPQQHSAMAATQASSGKTMRQVAAEMRAAQQQASRHASRAPLPAAKHQAAQGAKEGKGDEGLEEDIAYAYEHQNTVTEELERQQHQLEQ